MGDGVPEDTDGLLAEVVAGFGAGSRIAGYRLEGQIGAGGMAVVFRARDERLGRLVALKILAPALAADQAFRQRFIRESRAAAAVDDPHIIPVFEAGEADGVLFIAMRYVPGGDLRTLLDREGQLLAARAAAIISLVASALDAAHAAGLVHRDVKPANMLLDERPGRPDHVYLSDFGLSKGALSSAAALTGTGQFLGTLDYTAPEQIEGKPVDGRTDQYALACTAFELLSGAPPFRRDGAAAVMYAQLSEPPPPLASRRPGLPPAVDGVFARALAKLPRGRYTSCQEFADALHAALGIQLDAPGPGIFPPPGHPATGPSSTPPRVTVQSQLGARGMVDPGEDSSHATEGGRAGRPARRRRILVGTAAGITVLGLIAAILIILAMPRTSNWTYVTGGPVLSRPVQADGTIYVGSDDHNVYAINGTTGRLRWKYSTGGSVFSRPVVARGIVYAGSDDHNVYAINRITGRLRWESTTGGPISSSPAVARGIVYIGSDDHYIYALRAGNGHIRWRYATDGQVFSSPIVAGGTVYISSYDKLYALNAATSRVRWTSPIDDPKTEYSPRHAVLSRPGLADGVVYVGSDDHKIYAFNAATGQLRWTHTTAGPVESSPAVADGIVYVGSDDHKIYALNAATGQLRWTHTTAGPVESSPAVADGIVYVGSDDHKIYALNAATGQLRWTHTTAGPVESSPAVVHGFVYIGSDDHKIYELNADTGS